MLVCGYDDYVREWVTSRLEDVGDFGASTAIGIASDGKLIAGCVYHNYRPRYSSIEMSIASVSPMWARRENIKFLLDYPFRQLEAFRVYASIRLDNEKAQKAVSHIGFKREAVLNSMFGPNIHGTVYRILRHEFEKLYGDT